MSDADKGHREFLVRAGYPLETIIQTMIAGHTYDTHKKGARPTDPGWHPCRCGEWEGYWVEFDGHVSQLVADELKRLGLIVPREETKKERARVHPPGR